MIKFFSFDAESWAQDVHEHRLDFPSAAEAAVQRGCHNLLAEYSLLINIINGHLHLEGQDKPLELH